MLITYGTRPEHFDAAFPFTTRPRQRIASKMDGWSKALIGGAAAFAGQALLVPSMLVLLSPFTAATMN